MAPSSQQHDHQGHHATPRSSFPPHLPRPFKLKLKSKQWQRARKYGLLLGGIVVTVFVIVAICFIVALLIAVAIGCSIYGLYKYVYLPYQAGQSLEDTFQHFDSFMEQRFTAPMTSSDAQATQQSEPLCDVTQLCQGLPFIVQRILSSIYPYTPVSAQQWAQKASALRGNVNNVLRSDARIVAEHGVNVTTACPLSWTSKKKKHAKKDVKTVKAVFTVVNEQGVATDAIVKAKVKILAGGHLQLSKMTYINKRTDTKFKLAINEATKTI